MIRPEIVAQVIAQATPAHLATLTRADAQSLCQHATPTVRDAGLRLVAALPRSGHVRAPLRRA